MRPFTFCAAFVFLIGCSSSTQSLHEIIRGTSFIVVEHTLDIIALTRQYFVDHSAWPSGPQMLQDTEFANDTLKLFARHLENKYEYLWFSPIEKGFMTIHFSVKPYESDTIDVQTLRGTLILPPPTSDDISEKMAFEIENLELDAFDKRSRKPSN